MMTALMTMTTTMMMSALSHFVMMVVMMMALAYPFTLMMTMTGVAACFVTRTMTCFRDGFLFAGP